MCLLIDTTFCSFLVIDILLLLALYEARVCLCIDRFVLRLLRSFGGGFLGDIGLIHEELLRVLYTNKLDLTEHLTLCLIQLVGSEHLPIFQHPMFLYGCLSSVSVLLTYKGSI